MTGRAQKKNLSASLTFAVFPFSDKIDRDPHLKRRARCCETTVKNGKKPLRRRSKVEERTASRSQRAWAVSNMHTPGARNCCDEPTTQRLDRSTRKKAIKASKGGATEGHTGCALRALERHCLPAVFLLVRLFQEKFCCWKSLVDWCNHSWSREVTKKKQFGRGR